MELDQVLSEINSPVIGATALWDPWDASPPTLVIMPSVFRPIQLLQLVVVFAVHCGKLKDLLAEFKGERNKGREGVKHGWSHNGRRGRDGDEKEGDPSHRSNFSAVVAPMSRASVHRYAAEQLFLLKFSSSESILVVYSVTAVE